jgi:RNA polymerase sigma factor (sigma-70 family)
MDEEDLIQEILLWWVTQRQWYNKQRGASIQTFFRHVARNRLSDIYQEQTTEKRGGTSYPLSLNRPVLNKEGDTAELGDFVPNPKDVASEVEGQIERDRILAWLTPRQRELAQGLAQDYSLAEMARRMKVPRTTLKDELIRIQRILRKNGYRSNDVGNQR